MAGVLHMQLIRRTPWFSSLVCAFLFAALLTGAEARPCERALLAFRLDDVQDWWLSEAQRSIIDLFGQKGLPLTIGIIGGYFGADTALITSIVRHRTVEVANHGLHARNATNGRSVLLSQTTPITLRELRRANERIAQATGHRARIFIPHQNEFNARLLSILGRLQFSYVSSSCFRHLDPSESCIDACSYEAGRLCQDRDPFGLRHAPAGAATKREPSVGNAFSDVSGVIREIELSAARYGFAVVMMHPQDFVLPDEALDPTALDALRTLLATVQSIGTYRVVPLSEVTLACPKPSSE
jgi:peptidoglycan/xylan/chitin deacetylase (PgdA/CDA1 family)